MQAQQKSLSSFMLIGIEIRTNNNDEMDPEKAKIPIVANQFSNNKLAEKILRRSSPGITYAVYTNFESDENGEYTYFIGEKVSSFANQDLAQFNTLTIPNQQYQCFTTPQGKIPNIIIDAWQQIWTMSEADFEGKRRFEADFEVYDQRVQNSEMAAVDIYIGTCSAQN